MCKNKSLFWNNFIGDSPSRIPSIVVYCCLQSVQQRDHYCQRGNARGICIRLCWWIVGYLSLHRIVGLFHADNILQHAIWGFSFHPEPNISDTKRAWTCLVAIPRTARRVWTTLVLFTIHGCRRKWQTGCRRKVGLLHARPHLLLVQSSYGIWRLLKKRRLNCRRRDQQSWRSCWRRWSHSSCRRRRSNSWRWVKRC